MTPLRSKTCSRCGCQGHGQTYQATCRLCGGVKYPVLQDPPTISWTCSLCSLEGRGKRREQARVAGQRGREVRASKRRMA